MKRPHAVSRRFILTVVALFVIDSLLDNGVTNESRRLQNRDSRILQSPLPPMGAHFVTVSIGEPAQRQRLMVSLATEFTSFPCSGCANCGVHSAGKYFNFTSSLVHSCRTDCAFTKSKCEDSSDQCIVTSAQTSDKDLEGAFRGFEVRDIARLNIHEGSKIRKKPLTFDLDFICTSEIRGLTQDLPGDGLLSLSTAPSSFVSQMYGKGKVENRMFSLCFSHASQSQGDGASLGSVHFGEINRKSHSSTLVWALNTGRDTVVTENYVVSIKNVFLGIGGGGNPLLNAARGTMSIVPLGKIIDSDVQPDEWMREAAIQSNKPFTVLPKKYESAFHDAFLTLVGKSYDQNGIALSKKQLDSMPTMFLQIEPHMRKQGVVPPNVPGLAGRLDAANPYDIILAIPAHHYASYNEATGIAIPTIQFSGKVSFLGANVLQGHELVFDLDNHRIGFAEITSCDTNLVLANSSSAVKGRGMNNHQNPLINTTSTENGKTIGLSKPSRSGDGNGIHSELPDRGYSTQSELESWKGQGRGRAIDADPVASDGVDAVGGLGSQPGEIPSGIPPASGDTTFHVGPEAVAAATTLHGVNSRQAFSVDWIHGLGFLLLLSSFGITFFATRDKTDDRHGDFFISSGAPLLNHEFEGNAWTSPRRSSPGVLT